MVGQEDGFRVTMQAGCPTEDACLQLREEARGRLQRCQPNTIGVVRCDVARADLDEVEGWGDRWRQYKRRNEEEAVQRERAAHEARREQERTQQEEERRQVQAEERQQRERAAWLILDLPRCSERGDPRACEAIEKFITGYPGSTHMEEAASALRVGRAVIAAVEDQEAARARKEAEEEARRARARPAEAPAPPSTCSRTVQCCDGTCSPTCTTVHRGCCSHHGGVCD